LKPKTNEKLKNARLEKGFTQEDMATMLGYSSKSGYAMIETGQNKPTLITALKISKIFGKDVSYLFGELVHV